MTARNDKVVTDSVFRLRRLLTDIQNEEFVEEVIAKELADIQECFDNDGGAFYREMHEDSVKRAKTLIQMRVRAQEVIDRLSAFLRRDDIPRGD